jgi:UDP-N-acetylglucosamine 4,6-dehydratase
VPKIPSIRIVDLAEAMAPGMPVKIVGIRPGEKLHEVMCSGDYSHMTLEFDDHYLLKPSINFYQQGTDYSENRLGEKGRPVAEGFEYNSGSNPNFLSPEEIQMFNTQAMADNQ